MKKTLSVLLSMALVLALLGGLSATAFADTPTIQYTLKSGETVAKVCQQLGIDFVKNYSWITTTNHITNYSSIPVGTVLTLPAPGTIASSATGANSVDGVPAAVAAANAAAAAAAANAAPAANAGTTVTPAAGGTTVVPAAAATGTGDPVSFYLIQHTLKKGETVYSVCNTYGIKFDANANTISKLNNIGSYTSLKVGQVLLLPSAAPPASGNYYRVLGHKVVSGDTVAALCKNNGIDYGRNMELLKALNNKTDLTVIKVGETFYLPILASAGGTAAVIGGTTAAGGTTVAPTGTTTATTGTVPAANVPTITYTMKSGDTVAKVCQKLGVDFYKNYAWITATNNIRDYSKVYVGQVLTLPAPGTVVDGTAAAPGTAAGGAAVPTAVTPSSSGSYSLHTSSNGTYLMQVGGQIVNSANQGQTVTIVPIPDKGYMLESITVTRTGANERVAVTNNSFVMPGFAVSIVVTFKPAG